MRTVSTKFYYHLDGETESGGHMYVLPVREDIAAKLEGDYNTAEEVAGSDDRYSVASLAISYLLELETGKDCTAFIDSVEIIRPHTMPYSEEG